jgi:hypothetical protein
MSPLNVGETSKIVLLIIPLIVRTKLTTHHKLNTIVKTTAMFFSKGRLSDFARIKVAIVYAAGGKINAQYPKVTGTLCFTIYSTIVSNA